LSHFPFLNRQLSGKNGLFIPKGNQVVPRANRYFLPGTVWHLTHRCHNKEFLLRFERDRRRWKHWLFQARKRYGLSVLNYIATSNHIHLLIYAREHSSVSRGVQLAAGQTAQEYNRRKDRHGAFWQDRFHATAVSSDRHLVQCLVYIDLNMVRAGVVSHPAEWKVSGFNEIQNPPHRRRIIDRDSMCRILNIKTWDHFQREHDRWVTESLSQEKLCRDPQWTRPIAVGPEEFVNDIKRRLESRAYRRKESCLSGETWSLEDSAPSRIDLLGEMRALRR